MHNHLPAPVFNFLTGHPRLMVLLMLLLACTAWLIIYTQNSKAIVVYEGF